jgi:hypothetical protein
MVEDIQGAINPIIQAMIATANLQKQGQQQEIDKDRIKQEADAKKEQLKQSQQILENMHAHMTAEDEANAMHAQANMLSTKASVAHTLQSMHGQGGVPDPMAVLGAMTPMLSHALGGGGQIPQAQPIAPSQPQQAQPAPDQNSDQIPQQLPIAQNAPAAAPPQTSDSIWGPGLSERNKMEAEAAGLKAKAEAEGKLPSEQTLAGTAFQNQTALQKSRLESEEKVAALGRTSQEKIAGMSRGTQMAVAQMEAKTRLQVAGMGGDEGSQNLVHSLALGGATGEIKLNPANPLERLAYSQLQQAGGQDVDTKQIQAAKESQKMLPLLTKLEDYAKDLPDTVSGAFVQGHVTGAKNALGISSDLQNKINIINSQAMVVGKAVEGLSGRPLSTQLKLDLDTLASPGITKSMMLDRINNLRENYVNNQMNVVFSGMPDWQKELNMKKWGIQPVATKSPQTPGGQIKEGQTATGTDGHQIVYRLGKWYDAKTGSAYPGSN